MLTLRREEGQALVETALSMALFIVMMLGAVEFGLMAISAIEVGNAAKAAAQYAAQTHVTAADSAGMLQAAKNEYHTPAALTATSGYACTCAGTGTTVVCTNNSVSSPACPGSYMEVTVTIQTQVSYTPGIHIPGLAGPFALRGSAKQKVLQ